MERRRRWLASLLALVLAVGLLPTAAWAEGCTENLECAADKHTLYCPKNGKNVTRAELAEMIYNAFYPSQSASSSGFGDIGPVEEGSSEQDPCTDTQRTAINVLVANKIISGKTSTTFDPDGEVTFAEAAVVLWRTAGSPSYDNAVTEEELPYTITSRTAWYAPAYLALVSMGAIKGTSDGKPKEFPADDSIKVMEMVSLTNLCKTAVDGGGSGSSSTGRTRLEMLMEAYEKYKDSPLAASVPTPDDGELNYFADTGSCTKKEKTAIYFFRTLGVVSGYNPDNNEGVNLFGPYAAASSFQAAKFLSACAAKFEGADSAETQSEQEITEPADLQVLSAAAVSYADPIDTVVQFFTELGLDDDALMALTENPNAPVTASNLTQMTEVLVPERPTITVTDGQATISTTETDAVIYYTTDGTTPTVESAKYTSEPSVSVPVTQGTTVKAVAVKNSLYSEVATYTAPVLTITPSPTSLTGGGTVTFTVTNAPTDAAVSVTCSDSSIAVSGSGTAWTATLPNADATYTFTVAAGTATDTCTVTVTRRSTSSSGSSSSSSNTTTSTERNPDGSTTTTTTNKTTGTVTETTRYPDGSREVVETKRDGTVTTTSTDADGNQTRVVESPDGSMETAVDNADGTASVTAEDPDGRVTVEAVLPASAVNNAGGEAVVLPMPAVRAERDRDGAPTVTVDLPRGASVPVEIPVENAAVSTVALLVHADGTEEIVKTSLATENGVAVSLSDGDTVKIVDNGKTFYDVPGSHWGAEAIDFVTSRELFGGTSAVTFEPERSMNRGMLVTVLYRLENEPNVWGGGSYTDVPEGMYYSSAVAWADGNGIVTGYADAAFAPGRDITREEMAVVLYRYARYKGLDVTASTDLGRYTDADSISAYAQEAMAWTTDYGLVTADTTGALTPKGYATRAQVATILQRFLYLMDG